MNLPTNRTARVIAMAVEIAMEDKGFSREQAEDYIAKTVEALSENGIRKLTQNDIQDIQTAMNEGWTGAAIAEAYGITRNYVYEITRKREKHDNQT